MSINNSIDVSVVMACRNSDKKLLTGAILSVLNQSLSKFEFIIVDDGSEKPLECEINYMEDKRIRLLRISPSGLGAALNHGVSMAQGKYIARIDDDDVMAMNRLVKQLYYLENNQDVVCVGSQIFLQYNKKYVAYRRYPLSHDLILKDLMKVKFSIAHPAVMFRKDTFEKINGYRVSGGGQDLDLFLQFALHGALANIDDNLIYYNLSNGLSVNFPVEKYKAYLFALKDVLDNDAFYAYRDQMQKSIDVLEEKIKRKKHFSIKRYALRKYVQLFGRSMS
ncbi:glycosyltransferase [Prosthecochloris sp. SCSIO W1101]|uniref:glycosyltransferase n=1 Tax=Prosthecochloris sp. SCSIO W1101 TaxID=2992242 RepID=UPI00223E2B50|nr:glycosyltransferase [Prosthecochloris sp. SCSIO W1101]UZJ41965.1 glycosyltransferase [Prosthecochloris sp. SCSIO W1101]